MTRLRKWLAPLFADLAVAIRDEQDRRGERDRQRLQEMVGGSTAFTYRGQSMPPGADARRGL